MLSIVLVAIFLAIVLASSNICATLLTRITAIALLYSAFLSYNSCTIIDVGLDSGLGLYSGLIHATTITQLMEVFLVVSGALILLPWSSIKSKIMYNTTAIPTIPEYPMIILFTTIGGTFLLASADLVSIYLAIELQSFGVYILSALYRESESATAAGLKYFLLGALSSALILLGSALVYGYTGLTNLDSIYELLSVPISDSQDSYASVITLGFIIITIGLLFKVASAPFHYWAPDVYDGTPTIVTTWLTVIPKISIFVFLLEMYREPSAILSSSDTLSSILQLPGTYILILCSFLSLVIGTVHGLGQYRFKRLMAYSTISHVGFLLAGLGIANSTAISTDIYPFSSGLVGEISANALLFYLVQYSLTNINVFFVLLAFGYLINNSSVLNNHTTKVSWDTVSNPDVQYISELQGQFRYNPVLGLSLAICLFSIAGVPPLIGFFAKYTVLYSAIQNGYVYLAVVAILASVVSAAYYLRVIRVIHFDAPNTTTIIQNTELSLTSVHSYVIASLTLFILLFALNPALILNSTMIMAISLYTT